MKVAWKRPGGSRVAHAFAEADMPARLDEVKSRAECGDRFPVEELQDDELAERCAACVRAVLRQP